jgi:hypothetical protein
MVYVAEARPWPYALIVATVPTRVIEEMTTLLQILGAAAVSAMQETGAPETTWIAGSAMMLSF